MNADEQRADDTTIRDSLATSKATAAFAKERQAIRALLGIEDEGDTTIAPRQRD